METTNDFVNCLDKDLCLHIMGLFDPIDVVRAAVVSKNWRHFVIANGLAKQLCLKVLPQLSTIAGVVIGSTGESSSAEAETSTAMESELLERDHTVYASLLHATTKSNVPLKYCIEYIARASSANSLPIGSNYGQPGDLIYKLRTGPWLINEIDIQPFKVFFQNGRYISARFRVGHPKSATAIGRGLKSIYCPLPKPVDDKFVWSYTSPEFPMSQPFELPEPTLCVGGYVLIEILDRFQCQNHELFYFNMSRIKIMGRPLFPAFDAEIQEASGEILLRYYPQLLSSTIQDSGEFNLADLEEVCSLPIYFEQEEDDDR
ncbi:hypothetical protein ACS0TY_019925 [Phlomoides rotata]